MRTFLKLINLLIIAPFGLYIGLYAVIVIAVYVAIGVPARDGEARGAALFKEGRFSEGAVAFEAALRNAPVLGTEAEMAGVCHLFAGEAAAAEEILRQGREKTPLYSENLRWSARARAARGSLGEAAEILRRAAEENPLDPTLLGEAAEALYACGRKEEARAILENLPAARLTWNPVPALARAKFAAREGDWAAAEREIDEAARHAAPGGPSAAEVYRLQGALHARAGRDTQAREAFSLARASRYAAAARLRAAVLPDALLIAWEADAPGLRGAYVLAPDLAPRAGLAHRAAVARDEILREGLR